MFSVLHLSAVKADESLEKLLQHVPGIPGEDYPIFPIAPDTSFLCEVQPIEEWSIDFATLYMRFEIWP